MPNPAQEPKTAHSLYLAICIVRMAKKTCSSEPGSVILGSYQ